MMNSSVLSLGAALGLIFIAEKSVIQHAQNRGNVMDDIGSYKNLALRQFHDEAGAHIKRAVEIVSQ